MYSAKIAGIIQKHETFVYDGILGSGGWKRQTNSGDGRLRGLRNGGQKTRNKKRRYSRAESRAAPACAGQGSSGTRETQQKEQPSVKLP